MNVNQPVMFWPRSNTSSFFGVVICFGVIICFAFTGSERRAEIAPRFVVVLRFTGCQFA